MHDGESTSIAHLRELCDRHDRLLAEGPVGLFHRIVDTMVDHYRPVMDALETPHRQLEEEAFTGPEPAGAADAEAAPRAGEMRRVLMPQRDVLGRLARREFSAISDEMAYRFRDVHDHVVRLADEAILFQDRVTGILEVNLASISNRLNQVMKVLTVMSTIFLPLTVLSGMWGMNVPLPHFPGGDAAQFWWVAGIMAAIAVDDAGDLPPQPLDVAQRRGQRFIGCRPTSPTRSPPARWSSARPPWSRSWSRTRSTPARRASPSPSRLAASG